MLSLVRGLPAALPGMPSRLGGLRTWLAFAAVYVVWGSTYLAIRIGVETIPPFLLMGARSLAGGALLFAWARWRGGPALRPAEWREALLQGGLFFLGCHGALAWAEERVPSGQAALLFATLPAWMVLGEWLGPERVRPGRAVAPGLLLGMAGVAVLMHPSDLLGLGATDPAGAVALLWGSLSWVAGSLRARHAPLPGGVLQGAGANLLAGGVLLVVAGGLRGELAALQAPSTRSLLALGYLVGFGTMLALTAYLWLLRHARPTLVSTYAFVNPLVAVVLGALAGDELLDARTLVATSLMVASVAILIRDQARRRETT